jgi:hypothetical protein
MSLRTLTRRFNNPIKHTRGMDAVLRIRITKKLVSDNGAAWIPQI